MDGTLVSSGSYYLRQVAVDLALSPFRGPLGPYRMVRLLNQFRAVRERLRAHGVVPGLHRVQFELTAERLRIAPEAAAAVLKPLLYESEYVGLVRYIERDARESLLRLKRRPLKLGVLSDYPTQRKLAGMGLADIGWDVLLSSEDVDALKPHPALFLRALEVLEVAPGRALYVGDRRDTDVAGARAAGLKTCLIKASHHPGPEADFAVGSLSELADRLGC